MESSLILIDLGKGQNRLGGSALAQVHNQTGNETPDGDPITLSSFFKQLRELKKSNKILAYHDRSDGGLFTTMCEMAFASRCGIDIDLGQLSGSTVEKLFSEELGVVIQVKKADEKTVLRVLSKAVGSHVYTLGIPVKKQRIIFKDAESIVYENSRAQLEMWWSETSYQLQKLRDNPECADQEFAALRDDDDPGLSARININPASKRYIKKPKVAVFREQGVNGHVEMAAAFDKAGFTSVDVHLNDIVSGRVSLESFSGLAACGGFSYGDVLGAGEGWAKTILFNNELRDKFAEFFNRENTFTLGVCNGCQMLSPLKELIPGADFWPRFLKNKSEQFEARLALTRINKSPSVFFKGMEGSMLPVPIAHGEGRAVFKNEAQAQKVLNDNLAPMQYVNNNYKVTDQYPSNPNGSFLGITALTTPDGRATIMMPHPERAFMSRQLSWYPKEWEKDSPWLKMFQNARIWLDTG